MCQRLVKPLSDLSDEGDNSLEWGIYLFANICDILKNTNFTIYYSDGFEIITSWFTPYLLKNHVGLSLIARGSVEKGISATQVRKMLMENNPEVEKFLPEATLNRLYIIKEYLRIQEDVEKK